MTDYGYVDVGKLADFANNTIGGLTANYIMRFPRADVQPVKHGRWTSSGRDNDYNSYLRCSRCNHEIVMYRDSEKKPPNYCENCGADMRGDTNG